MVYTSRVTGEHRAGCSKRPAFSPAQPRRAETRLFPNKAAASEEARRTLRYVEPLNDARTPLADFFSFLLVLCAFLLVLATGSSETFADEPAPLVKVLVTYHSLSGNTERMAEAVADGVKSVPGAEAILKRVGKVTADDLFSADAVVVGSPVYWSNMSGEVKTFFDNWQFKFGVFPEFKMKNKIGAAFATGGQVSSGKELTMLTILAAMLGNQMIVVSGGGAFGASATTEGDSPGIDKKELADAKELGRRVAEVAVKMQRGSSH